MKKICFPRPSALAVLLTLLISGCLHCPESAVKKTSDPQQLKIGWAKRSIAVPGNVPISGQYHTRIACGEYSPVIASALAISNSQDAVIFVALDVVTVSRSVYRSLLEILKKEAPEIPVSKIIISATHSHTGPTTNAYAIK